MICLTTASFSLCINGEIHGFFKSSRGLRQGDLISPYLFTLVMEVLNLMIKRQIGNDKRFKFHSGCKALNLTHLCFTDDLLLLCHGDLISACVLRGGLDEFSMCSGLYPSMEKSTSYFCNVFNDIKVQISLGMPLKEGTLPIRYLGVPMMTRKLRNDDCRVLIDNVKKNIFDWKKKYLSYAGRLQLIASVLSSLNVYWASIQGGLGLRSMELMNEGLMIKYLWNIVSKKDSLWVKWVNSYRLKGKCVWTLSVSNNTAWSWRHILKLRNKAEVFLRLKLLSLDLKWYKDVGIAAKVYFFLWWLEEFPEVVLPDDLDCCIDCIDWHERHTHSGWHSLCTSLMVYLDMVLDAHVFLVIIASYLASTCGDVSMYVGWS
ncbi:RNA-directed DNA polymerase, eukaryota, reverse transcriptase zinc-binding domain protein [Tanacetum coccineum]